MKLIFAPDSFKGSLTAMEITRLLDEAAQSVFPGAQTHRLPVADGGEGTVEALVEALGGEYRTARVTGPLGEIVSARWGLVGGGETAVVEMAQAAGLPMVPEGARDPRSATTYGVGQLMLEAASAGAKRLLIGIGGSATNDGGMGMLAALGASFSDEAGGELSPIGGNLIRVARADFARLSPAIRAMDITVICDVTNLLLGENGATFIYGPQKGATNAIRDELEAGMAHYARAASLAAGRDVAHFPGAGAAGGLGAALGGVLGAKLKSGVDAVLDAAGFDELLSGADLVVTGEGRIDGQSVRFGKVPVGVAKRCAGKHVPVLAIVGGMGEGAEGFFELGETSIMTTVNAVMPLGAAMADAARLYRSAAERAFRLIRMGTRMR